MVQKRMQQQSFLFCIILIFAYLVLSKDGYHQWDENCFLSEAKYSNSTEFTCFPFDHFRLHIIILTAIVNLFGAGSIGLFLVGLFYALIMLGTFYFSNEIFKQLLNKDFHFFITPLLMFMPLSLYFGWKSMSEVPALFFSVFSIFLFIKLIQVKKYIFSVFVAFSLYFAAMSRIDSPILFYTFIFSLIIINQFDFNRKKIIINSILVSFIFLSVFLSVFFLARFNPFERYIPSRFLYNSIGIKTTDNLPNTFERYGLKQTEDQFQSNIFDTLANKIKHIYLYFVKKVLFGLGIFSFILLVGLFMLKDIKIRFFFFWYFLSIIPSLLLLGFYETRYSYLGLLPSAVIVYFVLNRLIFKLFNLKINIQSSVIFFILIIVFTLLNNFFIYDFENSLHEGDYTKVISTLTSRYGDNYTILVPDLWSDYTYLKFVYPNQSIMSVYNVDDGTKPIFESELIHNVSQLSHLDMNLVFVCYDEHKQSTFVRKIITGILPMLLDNKYHGNCKKTWLFESTDVELTLIDKISFYNLYKITDLYLNQTN